MLKQGEVMSGQTCIQIWHYALILCKPIKLLVSCDCMELPPQVN